jgi:hypothetical protein
MVLIKQSKDRQLLGLTYFAFYDRYPTLPLRTRLYIFYRIRTIRFKSGKGRLGGRNLNILTKDMYFGRF